MWSDAGGVFIACVVSKKRTQELSLELVHGTEAVEARLSRGGERASGSAYVPNFQSSVFCRLHNDSSTQ